MTVARWAEAIELHLERLRRELRSHRVDGLSEWFIRRHVRPWRASVIAAERARLLAHAALFDKFLPNDTSALARLRPTVRGVAYTGRFSAFDYFEAEYSCALEHRIPAHVVGDGPKWQCGVALHPPPCTVVSLGSNFDDAFERGMAVSASHCSSYIVDPTLSRGGSKLHDFERELSRYNASLNSSVGVGTGSLRAAPLVPLDALLRDRFGGGRGNAGRVHVSVLKVDVEGIEYEAMDAAWAACASGWLTIDELNVEVHLPTHSTLFKVGALHALFAGARACGLMLHHKEVNTWSPFKACAEFAWVSLAHAQRTAMAVGPHP